MWWSLIFMALKLLLDWLMSLQQSGKTLSEYDKKQLAKAFSKCNQVRQHCMAMGVSPDDS